MNPGDFPSFDGCPEDVRAEFIAGFPEGPVRTQGCDKCPHACRLETRGRGSWCAPADASTSDYLASVYHPMPTAMADEWVCRACPVGPCGFRTSGTFGTPLGCPVEHVPLRWARWERAEGGAA